MDKVFLVVGGDLRQVYLAEALAVDNYVYAIGFERHRLGFTRAKPLESLMQFPSTADYLVLPLPASENGTTISTPFGLSSPRPEQLLPLLKEGAPVFGGRFTTSLKEVFECAGHETLDYFAREEFNVYNAVPTGEGAIQLALEELATTLYGERAMVIGYGRIGRVLASQLKALGAEVTVAARKYSDIAWAEIGGASTLHTSELSALKQSYTVIFNTVPSRILDKEVLSSINKDCLIIDLASKPGGVDFDAAASLGIRAIWALSLPGKVAPITSGRIVASTIRNILKERGEYNV